MRSKAAASTPKDVRAFMSRAAELGVDDALAFLREVDRINLRRRRKTVETAVAMLGHSLADKRIAVLGASFKPHTDDIRDSPALDEVGGVPATARRARPGPHDPQAIDNARSAVPTLDYTDEVGKVFDGAHIVLHLTEWPEYQELDP